jgi:hypothetical protein
MIKRLIGGSIDGKDTHKWKSYQMVFAKYKKQIDELNGVIIDPFARDCLWADITNDLNPNTKAHTNMDALDFIKSIKSNSCSMILFDPPFSDRQSNDKYGSSNLYASDSNKISLITKEFQRVLRAGGIVLKLGYNSTRIKNLDLIDLYLVNFGASRNDVIISVHKKMNKTLGDFN